VCFRFRFCAKLSSIMAKPKTPQVEADMDLSCVHFFKTLFWDVYQYFYNLPFLVLALMTCQGHYHIVQPPSSFTDSFLFLLNYCFWILLLPFTVIDLLSEAIVDVLEVAYNSTLYHAVYTGAAIGCLIVGDYASLAQVREWMDCWYLQKEEKDDKINNEVQVENIVNNETDEVPTKIDDVKTDVIPSRKQKKTIVSMKQMKSQPK